MSTSCITNGQADVSRAANPGPHYSYRRDLVDRRSVQQFEKTIGAVFLLIVLIVIAVLALIGSGQAHNPKFHVDSALLSPFDVKDSKITARWNIGILVRNPNKLTKIAYDDFHLSVFYKSSCLSETIIRISRIHQGPKEQSVLNATTTASAEQMNNATAGSIDSDMARGRIGFDVKLSATVTFHGGFLINKKIRVVDALCQGVETGFSANVTNGFTMLGGPTTCTVNVFEIIQDYN